MGWLGIDDTDHLDGGCTTFSMFEIIQNLPKQYDYQNVSLVRLYPFAKRRTRGNAALAVEIVGEDYTELMKFLDRYWNDKLLPLAGMISNSKSSLREQSPTDPGMVWFDNKPDEQFYWNCVTQEIDMSKVPKAAKSWGGHGRIGATAAVSWPGKIHTFEAITWRRQDAVAAKSPRIVDLDKLNDVDENPDTFMSRDLRTNSVLISPRGNCPVLFGLRAKTYNSARSSCEYLINSDNTENVVGYLIFRTNQATDDHLGNDKHGTVKEVTIKRRGSTKVLCQNGDVLMAFAESGDVKLLAQWLKPSDKISYNGLVSSDDAIHLERLKITESARLKVRPKCEECQTTLKSMGKNQPLRCPKCKKRFPQSWNLVERYPPFNGWVQPPEDSMRHLAKPLDWHDAKSW